MCLSRTLSVAKDSFYNCVCPIFHPSLTAIPNKGTIQADKAMSFCAARFTGNPLLPTLAIVTNPTASCILHRSFDLCFQQQLHDLIKLQNHIGHKVLRKNQRWKKKQKFKNHLRGDNFLIFSGFPNFQPRNKHFSQVAISCFLSDLLWKL